VWVKKDEVAVVMGDGSHPHPRPDPRGLLELIYAFASSVIRSAYFLVSLSGGE
jgi:hypothetical protein